MRPLITFLLFMTYILYTGRLSILNLLLGGFLATLAAVAGIPKSPVRWTHLLGAIAALAGLALSVAWDTLRAGTGVARLVFKRRPELRPEVLRVPLSALSPSARALVSFTLTLTPGEVALDEDGDTLVVHALQTPKDPTLLGKEMKYRQILWSRVESLWRIPS